MPFVAYCEVKCEKLIISFHQKGAEAF